uniref:Uncharacterized protein n=1 Tax=Magallana gigas TaxID=29159 RepID=K1RAC9_MAGGI
MRVHKVWGSPAVPLADPHLLKWLNQYHVICLPLLPFRIQIDSRDREGSKIKCTVVDIWVPPKLLQHSCFLASDCTGDFVGRSLWYSMWSIYLTFQPVTLVVTSPLNQAVSLSSIPISMDTHSRLTK